MIRQLTIKPVTEWQKGIVDNCSEAGVAVVFVKEFKGRPVSGLTQWLTTDKALIQLSIRYRTDDHLWFTFFHEAGHILNDSKKAMFVEVEDGDCESEDSANEFAADMLIPKEHSDSLSSLRSKDDVRHFARNVGIAPGIVVGQLQKRGIIPYSHLNGLKQKLSW